MSLKEKQLSYILLHTAVILFGFTAILGALINMPAVDIVWWRVLLTALSLLFFVGKGEKLSYRSIGIFLLIGTVVALHWLCFYGAIKLSNASIALICMATTSFFTSLIEPWITKSRWNHKETILGLLVIPGMALVVGDLSHAQLWGVAVGLTSAFLAALFASLNKRNIAKADPYTITFLEMIGAWITTSLILAFLPSRANLVALPQGLDWLWILILVLLCTTLAFSLALMALRHLSAFASNIVVNLEPVYGIILAMLILKEHKELSPSFYLGVTIIMSIVVVYPFLTKKEKT